MLTTCSALCYSFELHVCVCCYSVVVVLISLFLQSFIFHAHFAAIFPHPDVFAPLLLHWSASSLTPSSSGIDFRVAPLAAALPFFLSIYRYCIFFCSVCYCSVQGAWNGVKEITWKCCNSHKSMKNHRQVKKNSKKTGITWKSELIEK